MKEGKNKGSLLLMEFPWGGLGKELPKKTFNIIISVYKFFTLHTLPRGWSISCIFHRAPNKLNKRETQCKRLRFLTAVQQLVYRTCWVSRGKRQLGSNWFNTKLQLKKGNPSIISVNPVPERMLSLKVTKYKPERK